MTFRHLCLPRRLDVFLYSYIYKNPAYYQTKSGQVYERLDRFLVDNKI